LKPERGHIQLLAIKSEVDKNHKDLVVESVGEVTGRFPTNLIRRRIPNFWPDVDVIKLFFFSVTDAAVN
jgi:hypothetical protein